MYLIHEVGAFIREHVIIITSIKMLKLFVNRCYLFIRIFLNVYLKLKLLWEVDRLKFVYDHIGKHENIILIGFT